MPSLWNATQLCITQAASAGPIRLKKVYTSQTTYLTVRFYCISTTRLLPEEMQNQI